MKAVSSKSSLFYLNNATEIFNNESTEAPIRKNLSNFDYVAGPVLLPDHWCLFFISIKNDAVVFIDPLE